MHKVLLSDFEISKYEITNQQYCDFLNSIDSAALKAADWLEMSSSYCQIRLHENGRFAVHGGFERHPVVTVSWHGAAAFCAWLGGRLPTEAEWEFAARSGGKKIKYPWGDEEPDSSRANFFTFGETFELKAVGSYPKNELGLFDMAGNVWEWCADWYNGYYYQQCFTDSLVIDPKGPAEGEARVCRGGSWVSDENCIRTAYRSTNHPYNRYYSIGFRCVR